MFRREEAVGGGVRVDMVLHGECDPSCSWPVPDLRNLAESVGHDCRAGQGLASWRELLEKPAASLWSAFIGGGDESQERGHVLERAVDDSPIQTRIRLCFGPGLDSLGLLPWEALGPPQRPFRPLSHRRLLVRSVDLDSLKKVVDRGQPRVLSVLGKGTPAGAGYQPPARASVERALDAAFGADHGLVTELPAPERDSEHGNVNIDVKAVHAALKKVEPVVVVYRGHGQTDTSGVPRLLLNDSENPSSDRALALDGTVDLVGAGTHLLVLAVCSAGLGVPRLLRRQPDCCVVAPNAPVDPEQAEVFTARVLDALSGRHSLFEAVHLARTKLLSLRGDDSQDAAWSLWTGGIELRFDWGAVPRKQHCRRVVEEVDSLASLPITHVEATARKRWGADVPTGEPWALLALMAPDRERVPTTLDDGLGDGCGVCWVTGERDPRETWIQSECGRAARAYMEEPTLVEARVPIRISWQDLFGVLNAFEGPPHEDTSTHGLVYPARASTETDPEDVIARAVVASGLGRESGRPITSREAWALASSPRCLLVVTPGIRAAGDDQPEIGDREAALLEQWAGRFPRNRRVLAVGARPARRPDGSCGVVVRSLAGAVSNSEWPKADLPASVSWDALVVLARFAPTTTRRMGRWEVSGLIEYCQLRDRQVGERLAGSAPSQPVLASPFVGDPNLRTGGPALGAAPVEILASHGKGGRVRELFVCGGDESVVPAVHLPSAWLASTLVAWEADGATTTRSADGVENEPDGDSTWFDELAVELLSLATGPSADLGDRLEDATESNLTPDVVLAGALAMGLGELEADEAKPGRVAVRHVVDRAERVTRVRQFLDWLAFNVTARAFSRPGWSARIRAIEYRSPYIVHEPWLFLARFAAERMKKLLAHWCAAVDPAAARLILDARSQDTSVAALDVDDRALASAIRKLLPQHLGWVQSGPGAINETFVRLDATGGRWDYEVSLEARPFQKGRDARIDVERLVDSEAALVLLGPPGSGKSTVAEHLWYRCSTRILERAEGNVGGPRRLAVYANLPDLLGIYDAILDRRQAESSHRRAEETQNEEGIPSSVQAVFEAARIGLRHRGDEDPSAHGELWTTLPRLWNAGGVQLLLDSLNEVSETDQARMQVLLRELIGQRGANRIVVFSRTHSYEAGWLGDEVREYTLLKLDKGRIGDFVLSWARREFEHHHDTEVRARRWSEQLVPRLIGPAAPDSIRAFASNPLCLHLLALVARRDRTQGPALPPNRAALFGGVAEAMWGDRLRREQAFELLEELALKLVEEGTTQLGAEAFVRGKAAAEAAVDETLVEGSIEAGLLQRRGAMLRFVHQSLQEYFAARRLWGMSREDLREKVRRPSWDETFHIMAAFDARAEHGGRGNALELMIEQRAYGLLVDCLNRADQGDEHVEPPLVRALLDEVRNPGRAMPLRREALEAMGSLSLHEDSRLQIARDVLSLLDENALQDLWLDALPVHNRLLLGCTGETADLQKSRRIRHLRRILMREGDSSLRSGLLQWLCHHKVDAVPLCDDLLQLLQLAPKSDLGSSDVHLAFQILRANDVPATELGLDELRMLLSEYPDQQVKDEATAWWSNR